MGTQVWRRLGERPPAAIEVFTLTERILSHEKRQLLPRFRGPRPLTPTLSPEGRGSKARHSRNSTLHFPLFARAAGVRSARGKRAALRGLYGAAGGRRISPQGGTPPEAGRTIAMPGKANAPSARRQSSHVAPGPGLGSSPGRALRRGDRSGRVSQAWPLTPALSPQGRGRRAGVQRVAGRPSACSAASSQRSCTPWRVS